MLISKIYRVKKHYSYSCICSFSPHIIRHCVNFSEIPYIDTHRLYTLALHQSENKMCPLIIRACGAREAGPQAGSCTVRRGSMPGVCRRSSDADDWAESLFMFAISAGNITHISPCVRVRVYVCAHARTHVPPSPQCIQSNRP